MRALVVLLVVVGFACCTRPPPSSPGAPDGDAARPTFSTPACSAMCATLATVGCAPSATCAEKCDAALAARLIAPGAIACVTAQTTRAGVQACGGGFCP